MSETPFNLELAVAAFRNARDILKTLDDEASAKKKPIQARKDLIEGLILNHLKETKQRSARTDAGTATPTTKYTATLSDKTAFMAFVTENKLFDLLDRKANSPAVRAYLEEHKALPPGCNLNSHTSLNVRAPTSSTAEPEEDHE
jgi:hypothetical protein